VFPRDYPPADFQSVGQQMASPQARVLNTIRRDGSAVVKSGISSRDMAETLANKLASYGPHPSEAGAGRIPMSQIEVISQDLEEDITADVDVTENIEEDPLDLSSDYALYIANAGRHMMMQLTNLATKIQTDSAAAQNAKRWNLGDYMHQHYKTDDMNAINQVFEEYGVGGFFDQNLYKLLANWSSQGSEYVTTWKQYSSDVIKNSNRKPGDQSVHEQGVAEGSKVKTAKGYGDVVQGTDVKTIAKADLGKNPLNLPKGYGDVVQPQKLKTIAKAKGVAEGGEGSGRHTPGAWDTTPGKIGRVEKTAQGIRHHADPGRYGGTEDEPELDTLNKSSVSSMDKALGIKWDRESKKYFSPLKVDETNNEKIGGRHDADDFDNMVARLKKLAGAGPMRTVYDPARRVYKNVPHAVQPAQQPKKAK
jgi:hypothetical protein